MPLVNSKVNLGKLFGGYISSINYSLQTSSEISGATLVVVSEDSKFDEPSFNDIVTIPPFGLKMRVVEYTKRKDTKKTVLQIELEEEASKVLDSELVFIYGIHTDPFYQINNESYYYNKSMFIDKSSWAANSGYVFNPFVKFPSQTKNPIINYGDGINVIGISRISYFEPGTTFFRTTGNPTPAAPPQTVVFDYGRLNTSLSNYTDPSLPLWTADKESNSNLSFGYTLKNLYKLFIEKGISFDEESEAIMKNDTFLFSDAGTLRNALSSCLSKLGRSFYVDPFTQKIKIISNSDIAKINETLAETFQELGDVEGATKNSYTKSIKGVEAKHLVLKGSYQIDDDGNGEGISASGDPASQRETLYKYNVESDVFSGKLNATDRAFLAALSPILASLSSDREVSQSYALALRKFYGYGSSSIYGNDELTFGDFVDISDGGNWKSRVQDEFTQQGITNKYIGSFYDFGNTAGAYQLNGNPSTNPPKLPQDTELFQLASDYSTLNFGLYFSAPLSEKEFLGRQYQPLGKGDGSEIDNFNIVPVLRSRKVINVPELSFISRLLQYNENQIASLTVGQLADRAYQNGGLGGDPIRNGEYVLVCIKNLFKGFSLDPKKVSTDIKENFNTVNVSVEDGPNEKHLLVTAQAKNVFDVINNASKEAFIAERDFTEDRKNISYIKVKESGSSVDGGGSIEPSEADLKSINTIKSNVKNFSRRSFQTIDQNQVEKLIFEENIQDIIPYFEGPFIRTSVDYFRPPKKEDLDITKGVSSISVSISSQGVTTSVSYSSLKFKEIDFNFISETFGYNNSIPQSPSPDLLAFQKR